MQLLQRSKLELTQLRTRLQHTNNGEGRRRSDSQGALGAFGREGGGAASYVMRLNADMIARSPAFFKFFSCIAAPWRPAYAQDLQIQLEWGHNK